MNKYFFTAVCSLFFLVSGIKAQVFTFEGGVPAEWVPVQGQLSVSTEHYKEGLQSLCWNTSGTSVLNVSFPAFTVSSANSTRLQIYTPSISNDTLKVEFLDNTTVRRTANYLLNYEGWREFNRVYTEYASTASASVNTVRFTLKPSSAGSRKIYFDDVNMNAAVESSRLIGSQWILDKQYFNSNNTLLDLYANPTDISLDTPTSQQLQDIAALRLSQKRTPAAGTATELNTAKNYVNNYLRVIRNEDGSVSGKVINTTCTGLTNAAVVDLVNRLEILAAAAIADGSNQAVFSNYVDHLLDQGFAEGCSFLIGVTDYTNARLIPSKLLNALPACNTRQQNEILKLVRWISYYGYMYEPESTYLSQLNSDLIYLYIPHMLAVAALQTDDASALRELKAFKRFMDRNTEYTPGGVDILKVDGTGFHHKTQYNNYMYAYQTWTECIYALKGTGFKIAPDAYERLKKAILSIYTMATQDAGNQRYYANSLSGRNPFESGIQVFYSKDLFDKMVSIGGDCMGTAIDEEMAGAYNYFFQTAKYAAPVWNGEGFFQFNYSPAAIYRQGDWVVTMRAPTAKFWGAEIYNNENRFGRYQSHGTLEVMYKGNLTKSGYPTNGTGGGWDWNVVPGTTTVHYVSWQEMMPYQSATGRFDQYTKTKSFAGALAWKDCGMFASNFDQIDTWSGQAFTPTNLVFKKSMFAFEGIVISLGSGIGSSGTYNASMKTATNLFQEIMAAGSNSMVLDGNPVNSPFSSTISSTADHWILTPAGTGYFIPAGNDDLVLFCDNQTTPNQNGSDFSSPTTTSKAAKAYINHGIKPSGKKYGFVAVPGASTSRMQELAGKMAGNGGEIYTILEQSDNLHALTYKPLNVTACSFFNAVTSPNIPLVKTVSGESLLMFKPNQDNSEYELAVCNPNLNPQTDAVYGWKSSASVVTFTLDGVWLAEDAPDNVSFSYPVSGETKMTVTCKDGNTSYIKIKKQASGMGERLSLNDMLIMKQGKGIIKLFFTQPIESSSEVKIFSVTGQELLRKNVEANATECDIRTNHIREGVYLCVVYTPYGNKTFKWKNSGD